MLDLTTIPGKRISGWHQGPAIDAGRSLSQGPNGGSKVPARVPQGPKRLPSGPCWVDSGPECQSGKGVATARGSSGPGDRSFIISQGLERPRRELRMTFNQRRSLGILLESLRVARGGCEVPHQGLREGLSKGPAGSRLQPVRARHCSQK